MSVSPVQSTDRIAGVLRSLGSAEQSAVRARLERTPVSEGVSRALGDRGGGRRDPLESTGFSPAVAGARKNEFAAGVREQARHLEQLGRLEEAAIVAEKSGDPKAARAIEKEAGPLRRMVRAAGRRLAAIGTAIANRMPAKLSVTLTYGGSLGVPGIIGGGLTGVVRLNGKKTGRQPLDVGKSWGVGAPFVSAAYVTGNDEEKTGCERPSRAANEIVMTDNRPPPSIVSKAPCDGDGDDGGERKGWVFSLSAGPFYVTSRDPVLKIRRAGFYIPHVCTFGFTDTGSVGGSISVPFAFWPFAAQTFGGYVEHAWLSKLTAPVFKAYDAVVGAGRKIAGAVRNRFGTSADDGAVPTQIASMLEARKKANDP